MIKYILYFEGERERARIHVKWLSLTFFSFLTQLESSQSAGLCSFPARWLINESPDNARLKTHSLQVTAPSFGTKQTHQHSDSFCGGISFCFFCSQYFWTTVRDSLFYLSCWLQMTHVSSLAITQSLSPSPRWMVGTLKYFYDAYRAACASEHG